jgi:putative membrane protein
MLLDALLAYAHFVAIMSTAATLLIEAALCRPRLDAASARMLGRVDLLYLVAAILALSTGLLRVFWGLKGSAFYLNNPLFYVKLGLFLAVGLISIAPTLRFIRWARQLHATPDQQVSNLEITGTAHIIHLEIGLLALIPLLGSLMARGFGY